MSTAPNCLLAGVGSMLGDDQVGWLVAERIAENLSATTGDSHSSAGGASLCCRIPSGSVGVRLASVPLDVLDWMDGVQHLHVIDACRSLHPAGEIHRLDWSVLATSALSDDQDSALRIGGHTTHDFGIVDVLKLAEQTGRLPDDVVVWAIDGKRFELGKELTDEVGKAVPITVDRILAEVTAVAVSSAAAAGSPECC